MSKKAQVWKKLKILDFCGVVLPRVVVYPSNMNLVPSSKALCSNLEKGSKKGSRSRYLMDVWIIAPGHKL